MSAAAARAAGADVAAGADRAPGAQMTALVIGVPGGLAPYLSHRRAEAGSPSQIRQLPVTSPSGPVLPPAPRRGPCPRRHPPLGPPSPVVPRDGRGGSWAGRRGHTGSPARRFLSLDAAAAGTYPDLRGGYDVMVACQLPKLNARVRFPLPAPIALNCCRWPQWPSVRVANARRAGQRRPAGWRSDTDASVLYGAGVIFAQRSERLR